MFNQINCKLIFILIIYCIEICNSVNQDIENDIGTRDEKLNAHRRAKRSPRKPKNYNRFDVPFVAINGVGYSYTPPPEFKNRDIRPSLSPNHKMNYKNRHSIGFGPKEEEKDGNLIYSLTQEGFDLNAMLEKAVKKPSSRFNYKKSQKTHINPYSSIYPPARYSKQPFVTNVGSLPKVNEKRSPGQQNTNMKYIPFEAAPTKATSSGTVDRYKLNVESVGHLPLEDSHHNNEDSLSSYKVPHYTVTSTYDSSQLKPVPKTNESNLKAVGIWTTKSMSKAYYLHDDGRLTEERNQPKTGY